jgi:hypothetical protein
MPRYAIVSDSVVQNVVIADSLDALSHLPAAVELSDDALVEIGWSFHDGAFVQPQPTPVDPLIVAIEVRKRRNELLVTNVDPYVMNALRWGDLTEEQRQEVAAYRRALLDITDQPGFPLGIVWPEQPTFM